MLNKYKFDITWSAEDEGFIATCPEFPSLSAFGATRADALNEAEIVLKLFIESYLEDGESLPEPQTVQHYSGQLRVRLPKSLHARAAKMAAEDGISLNQYISLAIEHRASGQEVGKRISREVKNHLVTHSASQYSKIERVGKSDIIRITTDESEAPKTIYTH